jgi:hypothetical protein
MPLSGAANRRIAGHEGDAVQIQRENDSTAAHPGSRKRGFASGMAGTHHDDVVLEAGRGHE